MPTNKIAQPWITFPVPNPQAKQRLFCFPYAGGGAHSFRDWSHHLSSTIVTTQA
ncbi:MAG: hypothetical protein F6K19_03070 [Cyanothece sp. SIO1E1]|nr:hypothetical protein [Cyanothece sp. SIO1E1]